MSHEELPAELSSLEAQLASLLPSAPAQRDRWLFEAGRAEGLRAARRRTRSLGALACAAFLAAAAATFWPRPVDTKALPSDAPAAVVVQSHDRPAPRLPLDRRSYLALRMAGNPDAWPVAEGPSSPSGGVPAMAPLRANDRDALAELLGPT